MVLNRLVQRTSRILAIAALALGLTAGNASATTYSIGDLTALGSYSGASGSFAAGASISATVNVHRHQPLAMP